MWFANNAGHSRLPNKKVILLCIHWFSCSHAAPLCSSHERFQDKKRAKGRDKTNVADRNAFRYILPPQECKEPRCNVFLSITLYNILTVQILDCFTPHGLCSQDELRLAPYRYNIKLIPCRPPLALQMGPCCREVLR